MSPRISVCLPTYNRAEALGSAIAAVQRQTVSDWELIVGDDASSDHTGSMVKSFHDSRIRYYRHERNVGIYDNWNHLIGLARGEHICIYHDHDVYLPTILERSAHVLNEHPDVQFVHTALVFIDEHNTPTATDSRPFPEVMPGRQLRAALANDWHSPVMAATAMVRRAAYVRSGMYEVARYGLGCDKDMWFRLAAHGDVGYVREPQALIRARKKGGATSHFSWGNLHALIRMRADEIASAYEGDRAGQAAAMRRFALQRDGLLILMLMRAVVLEPPDVVTEGHRLARAIGGTICQNVAPHLTRSKLLRGPFGRWLLAVHRSRQGRSARRLQRAATAYCHGRRGLTDVLASLNIEHEL